MKGGIILFRGNGAAAGRYIAPERSRTVVSGACPGEAVAQFAVLDAHGELTAPRALTASEYQAWVDWIDPETGDPMGSPRRAGAGRRGSPRFAEISVNVPKSMSVAACLHPGIATALEAAERDAVTAICRWLGPRTRTRIGGRDGQELVSVSRMQVVSISHRLSKAGDPHHHIHLQIGARVWAADRWRALDATVLFDQQGTLRDIGATVIARDRRLRAVVEGHGLTLAGGEVAELESFNAVMSRQSALIHRTLSTPAAIRTADRPRTEAPGGSE